MTYTTSATISPAGSGLVFVNGYALQGTLADVGSDTTYTVTVTRANSYGSSVGTFTITATDVAPVQTNDTLTKALDFSGSSERAMQVDNSFYRNALKMANIATTVAAPAAGMTSNDSNSRPWATAIVFKADGNNSNQHIWNAGEGSGTGDDNIYLRIDANRQLYFGWGRTGSNLNECAIGTVANKWYGVYIAHNGTRRGSANATATNLADAFSIRITTEANGWAAPTFEYSIASNWSAGQTGGRMDRQLTGDFTIGGRGSNRNFHGKIASMVVTTLRRGVAMPTDAEIEEMIKDPKGWLTDYKVGEPFRLPWQSGNLSSFSLNDGSASYATQVWLMGDGTADRTQI